MLEKYYKLIDLNVMKNRIHSRYWIYNFNLQTVNDNTSIKKILYIYFLDRENNQQILNELTINVNSLQYSITDFNQQNNLFEIAVTIQTLDSYFTLDIDSYVVDGKKITLEQKYVTENDMAKLLLDEYIKNNAINFDQELSFEDNIMNYANAGENKFVTADMIINQLDLAVLKRQYNPMLENQTINKVGLSKKGVSSQFLENINPKILICTILAAVALGLGIIFYNPDSSVDNQDTLDNYEEETEYEDYDSDIFLDMNVGDYEMIDLEDSYENYQLISDDENIVSVSDEGMIEAISQGDTYIEVYNLNTEEIYYIYVTVFDFDVSDSDDYIIGDSDSRILTESDLNALNADQLKKARNEIFARHGFLFKDQALQDYFDSKSWYVRGTTYAQDGYEQLSDIEKENATFILDYENNY